MKTKLTLALVAFMTSTAFAEFQAPLPEFKNEKQLAEWRAEKASEATSQGCAAEETAFYTGKPYLASSAGYAFKFRSYNPEVARWTTEDPSGFPDGANGTIYAPCPTSDLDIAGLLKWSTLTNQNKTQTWNHAGNTLMSDVWTVETDDGSATISLWKDTKVVTQGPNLGNYNFNCHGFTFGNGQYWINGYVDLILKGDGYKLITGADKTGARVASWGGNTHTAKVVSVSAGVVTSVEGKLGAGVTHTSLPSNQGYGTSISYYE